MLLTKVVYVQHLIIDGSPKWDIYRTVPVSCSPSTSAVASMPQATNAATAEKSAPAAPAKRDRLLEAATKGGVLLSSSDYTCQVETLALMRCMLDLLRGSCLHTRWHVSQMQSFLKLRELRLSVACQGALIHEFCADCRYGRHGSRAGRRRNGASRASRRDRPRWPQNGSGLEGRPHVHQPWGQDANVTLISCIFLPIMSI